MNISEIIKGKSASCIIFTGGLIIVYALGINSCFAQEINYDCTEFPCKEISVPEPKIDYSWSSTQVGLEVATTTLLFVDYRQTLNVQTHPGAYETNKFLGPHPSNKAIKNYFVGAEILQLGAAYSFPLIRTPFLGGMVLLEGSVTARNRILGFTFKW